MGVLFLVEPAGRCACPLSPVEPHQPAGDPRPSDERIGVGEGIKEKQESEEELHGE